MTTLEAKSKEKALLAIAQICKTEAVTEVVIGLPMNMNGTIGPKAKEVLELVPTLEGLTGLSVKVWDERLTTKEATRLMIEENLSRRAQKKSSDRLAATLILQNYLEYKRITHAP